MLRLMPLYTAEKIVKALMFELLRMDKTLAPLKEKAVSLTIDYCKDRE